MAIRQSDRHSLSSRIGGLSSRTPRFSLRVALLVPALAPVLQAWLLLYLCLQARMACLSYLLNCHCTLQDPKTIRQQPKQLKTSS